MSADIIFVKYWSKHKYSRNYKIVRYEAHAMIIKIGFTEKCTCLMQDSDQEKWGDSKLVRHINFDNMLRSKTTCIHVTYNNVCITEPTIKVSLLAASLSSVASKSSYSIYMISILLLCYLSFIQDQSFSVFCMDILDYVWRPL